MRVLTFLFILFLVVPGFAAGTTETNLSGGSDEVQVAPRYVVWYCTTSVRCASCLTIEKFSKAAILEDLAAEVKSGRLAFRMVNYEEKEHAHFATDFQLYTKSLVIAEMDGDKILRWQNLPRVWELLGDEAAFRTYVKQGIIAFIAQGMSR